MCLAVFLTFAALACQKPERPLQEKVSLVPVDVEKVLDHPEQYAGEVSVEGIVTEATDTTSVFLLGCADACVAMPVKYTGPVPKAGAAVVTTGAIAKGADGKLIFEARDVRTK